MKHLTREVLEKALVDARSLNGVIKNLGYVPTGKTASRLKARLAEFQLEAPVTDYVFRARRELDDILVENSTYVNMVHLKPRLIAAGLVEDKCAMADCPTRFMDSWRGQPLVLQVDHINGVRNDNRIKNLRLLCPNCHTQTDTWGRKR